MMIAQLPEQISRRGGHPVAKLGINGHAPIQTNKFYANFFLGNRNQATWTHPYSVVWAKGAGTPASWGIAVSHIKRSQLAYGPGNPSQYYINPIGIQSIILSARELGNATALTMDSLRAFSANVNLATRNGSSPAITFPLVQGMGFVTAVFNASTPLIQSGVFFKNLKFTGTVHGTPTTRYDATLEDGTQWFLYMTANDGQRPPTLTVASGSAILADHAFSGSIQIAYNPNGPASQAIYDGSAGVYPLRGSIAGSAENAVGTYQLSWTKGGNIARPLLMFALPHHQQEMSPAFSAQSRSSLRLETTTKGTAAAIVAGMEDDELFDLAFGSPFLRKPRTVSCSLGQHSLTRSRVPYHCYFLDVQC